MRARREWHGHSEGRKAHLKVPRPPLVRFVASVFTAARCGVLVEFEVTVLSLSDS